MRVAFYAPLKAPDHPLPSGDRRMARAFMTLLQSLGHDVALACRLRSYDRDGDAGRQERLQRIGAACSRRLLRRYRRQPELAPELWFTYHLYHKAPDWLGPTVSTALGIPYVVAEASVAAKRAGGPWAGGYEAACRAIAQADLVLAMTRTDLPGLSAAVAAERLFLFPPFLDAAPFVAASARRDAARRRLAKAWNLDPDAPWLLTVAMMRADAKLLSYRLLAGALAGLLDTPWQLLAVGDGEARGEIERMLAPFGERRYRLVGVAAPEALPDIYAAADLYLWPACNEAYGMALLEAQAAGVPVVAGAEGGVPDVVAHDETGLLVSRRDPAAFAAAVRELLAQPERRRRTGKAAQQRVLLEHDVKIAGKRLSAALASIPSRSAGCASV